RRRERRATAEGDRCRLSVDMAAAPFDHRPSPSGRINRRSSFLHRNIGSTGYRMISRGRIVPHGNTHKYVVSRNARAAKYSFPRRRPACILLQCKNDAHGCDQHNSWRPLPPSAPAHRVAAMAARFQTFDETSDRAASGPRVAALRAELARQGLDGFIVPRADRYQNEYVPPSDERLAWISGFTGSAGSAIVLADRAALFVDGRYTLQAGEPVATAPFEIAPLAETAPGPWSERARREGQKRGEAPGVHTIGRARRRPRAAAGATLVAVGIDPVDAVWSGRPAAPRGAVTLHGEQFAGEPAAHKLERVRAELARLKADALVVSDPHAACWTFNIRGSDVAHTPLALAVAIVPREDRPALYVDGRKLTNAVREALASLAELREPDAFAADLKALGAAHRAVRLDASMAPDAMGRLVGQSGGKIRRGADPIALMKATKNDTEIAGTRAAHRRDGAAVTRFLAWLDREAPAGKLTEIDAVTALEDFR